ncbi:MAG TPA: arylsulfatase [Acidimicrobiales bacterium]|nr:arylsulfatase [Acidimicrobiales bacterium]
MTPVSPPPFKGRIGRTLDESEPHFPSSPHPDDDAPNVVLILVDDTGFAQLGCYGSDIDTPNLDALAQNGLQFTNFHVTPLCSPTRAALLTGRSQHSVGMRSVSNHQTGFPHQLGHISNHAATIAEVLKAAGYATFCTGKWHLAPTNDISAAGPFDQWPLGRGFDRFYGFLEGETDQFHPQLVVDNHHIDPPGTPADGYHLSEDLVDQLLQMINDSKGVRPDRPFFAYLPFGATHAPHQAPESYLAKYRGRYDEGWDVTRQRWYERQLELGVTSRDTELAPRNPGVEAWEDLPNNHRKFACRLQEAFAAFLDHTDDQVGRFIDGLRKMDQLENTILVFLADNGASQEGGPFGVMHEMKFFNGVFDSPDDLIDRIDEIGGPHSHTNYPWGWAQCGNTPFKWYKQNTHEGGVHVPMILHWPIGVGPEHNGTLRRQFVNVSDIAPTIYELLGLNAPETYNGLEQLPVTGRSFAPILNAPDLPATNRLQYFEQFGSRALIAEDNGTWWKAVTRHIKGQSFDEDRWELYNLSTDQSECTDLAEIEPTKLEELVDLWWEEAEIHGVLPLDDRTIELFGSRLDDHSPHPTHRKYRYRPPMSPIPAQAAPSPSGRSWNMTARLRSESRDEGVLYATGNENSGVTVFIQESHLVVDYNAFDEHTIVESDVPIPEGENVLLVKIERTSRTSGRVELAVNDLVCGSVELPFMMRMISSIGASVGYDHGSAVSARYDAPYEFTGELHEVVIELGARTSAETQTAAKAEMSRQ